MKIAQILSDGATIAVALVIDTLAFVPVMCLLQRGYASSFDRFVDSRSIAAQSDRQDCVGAERDDDTVVAPVNGKLCQVGGKRDAVLAFNSEYSAPQTARGVGGTNVLWCLASTNESLWEGHGLGVAVLLSFEPVPNTVL